MVASSRLKTPALPSSSTEESSSDSEHLDTAASLGFDDDKDFPVEIVPYLYLGNAANSEDLEALSKHGIQVSSSELFIGYIVTVFRVKLLYI